MTAHRRTIKHRLLGGKLMPERAPGGETALQRESERQGISDDEDALMGDTQDRGRLGETYVTQEDKEKESESEKDEGTESWVAGSTSSTEIAVDVVGRQARVLSFLSETMAEEMLSYPDPATSQALDKVVHTALQQGHRANRRVDKESKGRGNKV